MRGSYVAAAVLLAGLTLSCKPSVRNLEDAAIFGDANAARDLIAQGADPNQKVTLGPTDSYPAGTAAAMGELEVLKVLVSAGANVNAQDFAGYAPLHHAAKEGHKDIVIWLLANGANPNLTNIKGRTPSRIAEKEGHSEIAQIIAKSEQSPRVSP